MGMYCDEKAGDKLIDGVEGYMAVLHAGSKHIEIWCEEAERHYGNVPADLTPEQINVVMRFYCKGEERGIEQGKAEKQCEMQRVMGL